MERVGKNTVRFPGAPAVLAAAASVGKAEGEGPLANVFDYVNENDGVGSDTWEHAEAALVRQAAELAIHKAGLLPSDIHLAFAGDLLNQCTASTFGFRSLHIPFAGLFGACSTFALALLLSAAAVDSGFAGYVVAEASSHFCAAEKQFRFPLEYGGQRSPTAQRTVTGAGAAVIGTAQEGVHIVSGAVGTITDLGITDAANMGAAMAPAAARTIASFLSDTGAAPGAFDTILTGDLGSVGSRLLLELCKEEYGIDISQNHADCGCMIFSERQDAHAGGSGCGCSASVVCSKIIKDLSLGKIKKVLFVGTGALMSPLTASQGDSIPGIAHAVLLQS